ncbi:hypothetical protein MN116_008834 [Schistosoma mekongi]|uniref:Uncharacterized protein n=1 Tax=Schistosoma mekongi TaxID=38744 RepID=A0AAE1Z524_SCHME|nr:hypothetical protein MN116_008834 [Schistosoma mekongi]
MIDGGPRCVAWTSNICPKHSTLVMIVGDWENEHDKFVQNFQEDFDESPSADELPKFWKDPGSLSFLWQTDNLGCGGTADDGGETVVDVEATLQKLVLDETFEDPAILDISRKVPYQHLNKASFQHLRNTPAFPTAPTNILKGSRDIWSIESSYDTGHESSKATAASDCNTKSKGIIDIFRSLSVCPPVTGNAISIPVRSPVQNRLPPKPTSESRTRESGSETYYKVSQSPFNLRSVAPPTQYKAHSDTVFPAGDRVSQSQAFQNHPSVHDNGMHLNHPYVNSISLDILKWQLPTDANILPRLPLMQSAVGNIHLLQWDYSQIHSSALIRNQYVLQQNPSIALPVSSSQRNPLVGSPSIRGLTVSNMQPNLFPLLSHLSLFPIQSTNIESKQSVSQPSPTISCSKQPTQLVPSTEKLSTDSESDPYCGSWMTEYEAIGVLLIQLRPLMVSNPYVQDYYFASQWLRRVNAIQAKQITNGQAITINPPATMQLPIPIPLESLSDSNSPYQVTLKHKLVIPFSAVNLNAVLDQNVNENCDSFEKTAENQEMPTSESSNALGRPTRSNVHRPRVVAELSLVSALSSVSEQSFAKPSHSDVINNQVDDHVSDSFHIVSTGSVSVISNRKRLLVLAQIERVSLFS